MLVILTCSVRLLVRWGRGAPGIARLSCAGEYNAEFCRGEYFPVAASVAFAIKERNGGKLNSHAWALRGFVPMLKPKCVSNP
jgi:hypothetical protein